MLEEAKGIILDLEKRSPGASTIEYEDPAWEINL
jgi:hypothetical protein